MKKFILIQNDGVIDSNSFELIGASTKRNSTGKIGFFGSGLKYSIAYMMRNNIEFHIFAGENEVIFTTKDETFRGETFQRIVIDGKETSYTTTMGPTWTADWFVIREIYCNAIDEENCQLIKETENINPSEGKTRIYIEITQKMSEVIGNFESYFSQDREPFFVSNDVYTCALGNTDGNNPPVNQPCIVYEKTSGVIYRRGIRVSVISGLIYDYGFEFVNINEDRTASQQDYIAYAICDMVLLFENENYIYNILKTGTSVEEKQKSYEFKLLSSLSSHSTPSNKWLKFSEKYLLVAEEIAGKYENEIKKSSKEALFLPFELAKRVKKHVPNIKILGCGGFAGDFSFSECESTPKMEYLVKECLNSLLEMKYEINFPIQFCEFNDSDVLGQADMQNKQIYLSKRLFDLGKREICLTLMEENEHLITGYKDKTRKFQTHLFSMWLKSLEESNSLFL